MASSSTHASGCWTVALQIKIITQFILYSDCVVGKKKKKQIHPQMISLLCHSVLSFLPLSLFSLDLYLSNSVHLFRLRLPRVYFFLFFFFHSIIFSGYDLIRKRKNGRSPGNSPDQNTCSVQFRGSLDVFATVVAFLPRLGPRRRWDAVLLVGRMAFLNLPHGRVLLLEPSPI